MVEPFKFTEIEAILEKIGIPELQRGDLREAIENAVSESSNEKCDCCTSLHPELNIDAVIASEEKEYGEKEGILLDGIIEKDEENDDDDDEIDDDADDEDDFPPDERRDEKEMLDDDDEDDDYLFNTGDW